MTENRGDRGLSGGPGIGRQKIEGARVSQELQVSLDREGGGGQGLSCAPGVARQGIEGARVFQELQV